MKEYQSVIATHSIICWWISDDASQGNKKGIDFIFSRVRWSLIARSTRLVAIGLVPSLPCLQSVSSVLTSATRELGHFLILDVIEIFQQDYQCLQDVIVLFF